MSFEKSQQYEDYEEILRMRNEIRITDEKLAQKKEDIEKQKLVAELKKKKQKGLVALKGEKLRKK